MGGVGILWETWQPLRKPCYIILSLYVYEWLFILSQKLKRHRRLYIGLYDKLQNLFPINGHSFTRKPKLIATLVFYSSIRFVFETVFISEQIAENRFGALLEISDKFITKFNVFSYMVLQFRLKTVFKSRVKAVFL